jgi:hypothetical protein
MNDRETYRAPGFCELSLRRIDAALSSTAGAMLSLKQFDEVTRLRRLIRECCEDGREAEAESAVESAMSILLPHMKNRP